MESGEAVRNIRFSRMAIAVAVMSLALWATADVFAQGSGPCAEDAAKFCKDTQPGGRRMARCLKEHESDLSGACKEHIAQMKQKGREIHEACQDDVTKFCEGVKPGGGATLQCLKEHKDELSPECKEKLPSGRRGI